MSSSRFTRTDLAEECPLPDDCSGYQYAESSFGSLSLSVLTVKSDLGASCFQKPIGEYVTVRFRPIWLLSAAEKKQLTHLIARELHRLCSQAVPGYREVMVAGLGNRDITADAIGPLCADRILVTRCPDEKAGQDGAAAYRTVSAIAPGVVGQTGIETAELIRGAVRAAKPQLLICIDALATRSTDRLAGTVQLCNTGISPGSGVKNDRRAIDAALLGIPVIAVGVPTVVDSSTLVYDALEEAGIRELSPALIRVLENNRSFFVSPQETDLVTATLSALLADAVDLAMAFPL